MAVTDASTWLSWMCSVVAPPTVGMSPSSLLDFGRTYLYLQSILGETFYS